MARPGLPFYYPAIFTVAVLIVALLLAPTRILSVLRNRTGHLVSSFQTQRTVSLSSTNSNMAPNKTPVYFLSHGGVSSELGLKLNVYGG